MGLAIFLLSRLGNIFGTFGVNLVAWALPSKQLDEQGDICSLLNADVLSKVSLTIDSWETPMTIIDPLNPFNNSILAEAQTTYAQALQQMTSQQLNDFLQNAQNTQNVQKPPPDSPSTIKKRRNEKAIQLLHMRLGGVRGSLKLDNDDFLFCHTTETTVYVFFVLNGREGHITEEIDIFPSDKLLTQLRLIRS